MCDEQCDASDDTAYRFDACSTGVPGFGIVWSVEYFVQHFARGVAQRTPSYDVDAAQRTEHSCWVLLVSTTLPVLSVTLRALWGLATVACAAELGIPDRPAHRAALRTPALIPYLL